jgi:SAM-dependent methyltransferase
MSATCRACDRELHPILTLGSVPLANALRAANDSSVEERFPLGLGFCRPCALVQITHVVPPAKMFASYPYFSSFSDTMLAHARSLTSRLRGELGLGTQHKAIEVASNDGYLLQFYRDAGIPVLGIEPAENIADTARGRGIETISEFFGAGLAERLAAGGTRADVLHAHNVLAHVPEPIDFVSGLRTLLAPRGRLVVEVPYLPNLVRDRQFDTIYHEHVFYYSLLALDRLFAVSGLAVVDVHETPLHGGSLLVEAARVEATLPVHARVANLRERERVEAWGELSRYAGLEADFAALRHDVREAVASLRREGKRVAAYGAAAKGCMLLNHLGLGRDEIEFVADRSPHKQGWMVPGTRIPIVAPSHLAQSMPDVTLLLAWNFEEEILAQQHEYRARGGRFLVPLPTPRLV